MVAVAGMTIATIVLSVLAAARAARRDPAAAAAAPGRSFV